MKGNRFALRNLQKNHNAIWDVIIGGAFAVIFIVVALYIGTFVQGIVGGAITTQCTGFAKTTLQAKALNTTKNISVFWDTDVGMLNISLVIVIMTIPLMALVYIRKIM